MTTYAHQTDVTPEKSRADIEAVLKRYGATAFVAGWDEKQGRASVMFTMADRNIRLDIRHPNPKDASVTTTPGGKLRNYDQRKAVVDQQLRQRWRATVLYVTALCEAIETRVLTVDQAFLPFIVWPDGRTIAEWAEPNIERFVTGGFVPPLLTGGTEK